MDRVTNSGGGRKKNPPSGMVMPRAAGRGPGTWREGAMFVERGVATCSIRGGQRSTSGRARGV